MPKRIGYLFEKAISYDNVMLAIEEAMKHKRNHREAIKILENREQICNKIIQELITGEWYPKKPKKRTIYDSHRKKERNLLIPCLHDQIIHHVIMRVTVPLLLKRNYFYNCGSIPKAGQKRATDAVKGWLKSSKYPRFSAIMDVRKFYETCPHSKVMKALRRIIKDERLLFFHKLILLSMSSSGVGLAIGYYPSPWYANLVLSIIDNTIKEKYGRKIRYGKRSTVPKIRMVRYADDIILFSNNRRILRLAREDIFQILEKMSMTLKPNWRILMIKRNGVYFLGYRFFHNFTIMQKRLMRDVARRSVKAFLRRSLHGLRGVLSDIGILNQCNSYNFRTAWVYNLYSINKFKKVVGDYDRSRICLQATTV